jgi:tetratricopeptide (TPR) repeat protein
MFTLDNAKPARKINTMFGVKIVHYAKHANTNAPEVVEEQDKLELDFLFHSSDHLRYENGRHIAGPHGGAPRAVKVESNITGNEGYTVTMFNTSGGQSVIQMAPKQMKLVGSANEKIQLKGYGIDTMGGSFEDYGLTIIHNAGKIEKCVLHMYDRSVDIEYLNSEEQSSISKNQEENVNILEYFNLFKGFPMNVRIDLASRTDEVTNTGCQYYAKGDLKNAIIYFEKALKIFPLNDDALNNLAVCYSELNNYEKMNEAKNKLDQIRKLGL